MNLFAKHHSMEALPLSTRTTVLQPHRPQTQYNSNDCTYLITSELNQSSLEGLTMSQWLQLFSHMLILLFSSDFLLLFLISMNICSLGHQPCLFLPKAFWVMHAQRFILKFNNMIQCGTYKLLLVCRLLARIALMLLYIGKYQKVNNFRYTF